MDGPHYTPDKPMPDYSEYGDDIDDPILKRTIRYFRRDHTETDHMTNARRNARRILDELRQPYIDCECGCRGLNHIDPDARRIYLDLLSRFRN